MSKRICILFLIILFLGLMSYNLKFDVSIGDNKLNISKSSDKILIATNSGWIDFKNAGGCTGSGTLGDPYIIEDIEIDSVIGYAIEILNSDVHFIIENCTFTHVSLNRAAIKLDNIKNGIIRDNYIYDTYYGIRVSYSNNITISNNQIYDVQLTGIDIFSDSYQIRIVNNNLVNGGNEGISVNNYWFTTPCYEIEITGNSITSFWTGIYFREGENNIINSNILQNGGYGMYLELMNHNKIINNNIQNYEIGIYLTESICNTISNNIFTNNQNDIIGQQICFEELIIPILVSIFLVIAIISISIILVRRSKKKRKERKLIQVITKREGEVTEVRMEKQEKFEPKVELEVERLPIIETKGVPGKLDEIFEEEIEDGEGGIVQEEDLPTLEMRKLKESESSEELSEGLSILEKEIIIKEEEPSRLSKEQEIREESEHFKKVKVKFCTNCGKPLVDTWNICAYCGVRIRKDLWKTEVKTKSEMIGTEIEFQPLIEEPRKLIEIEETQEESKEEIANIKLPKEIAEDYIEKSRSTVQEIPLKEIGTKKIIKIPKTVEETKVIEEKAVEPKPLKNLCPFCGFENVLEENYCKQCGYKLKK